jgi:hypothetical protein
MPVLIVFGITSITAAGGHRNNEQRQTGEYFALCTIGSLKKKSYSTGFD